MMFVYFMLLPLLALALVYGLGATVKDLTGSLASRVRARRTWRSRR